MKHAPDMHEPDTADEDDLDRFIASLPPAPGIKHIDDDDAEEDALAEEDIAAGRVYPHALVAEWLQTWGQPDCRPFEEWLRHAKP